MKVFGDTSGFFARLVQTDQMHVKARENFAYFAEHNARLVTSSFVLVETAALLQRRIGLPPVHDFHARIFPLLHVVWVQDQWYAGAMHRLFAQSRQGVSLVDCLSFEILDAMEIDCAFAFDRHFEENGFSLAAFAESS